jgi:predicted nucleotidyltransferase
MDKKAVLTILGQFRKALERSGIRIKKMILFGSCATGTNTENSDIDVVVVSDSFNGLNHWQRIERMSDALYEIFQPIEARALTGDEWESDGTLTAQYVKSGALISI